MILAAQAERQSLVLRAEGERAAAYLRAQGQAKAIETVFEAVHEADPDPKLLAYQYLQTLPQIAQGDANKVWIVPSEFSGALRGLSGDATDGGASATAHSWLVEAGSAPAPDKATRRRRTGGPGLDTSTWFDGQPGAD